MKTLYLESIAGIAGDMFSASCLDAGLVTPEDLNQLPKQLHLPDVEIIISEVIRSNIRATHVEVKGDQISWNRPHGFHHSLHNHHEDHSHVPFVEVENLITKSLLDKDTKRIACQILETLAIAEAHCHGIKKEEVEFHELGTIDSILDIVMAAYCISKIKPESVIASPVKLGRGQIKTLHGLLPVPPPVSATLAIGMEIDTLPLTIQQSNIELSTPTGLAILKTLKPIFSQGWPEGKVIAQGQGAGTRDLNHFPNLFRICLFEAVEQNENKLPYLKDAIIEINANYDDTSPEYLSWAAEKLFSLGAHDVWQTTGIGKKGRVTIILSILVPLAHWKRCVDFILKHTPTFGLRYKKLERFILARHFEKRKTEKGLFQVKVGFDMEGNKLKEKFEFEDIKQSWDSN